MPLRKHAWDRRSSSAARAAGLEAARVPQRGGEVGGGLAVGAEPRRAIPRRPGVLEHGGAVAGRLGVMREPRRLGATDQGGQRRPMQGDAPVGRKLVLDRRARDLVAKADRVALGAQHPRRQTRLELRQLLRGDPLQQPDLRARSCDGHGLQQPARGSGAGVPRGQAPRRARCPACLRPRRASTSVTKNGLPPVRAWRAAPSTPCAAASRATAPGDSGSTVTDGPRAQIAEHDAQRVLALQLVVAVGRDHQRRHSRRPPAEQVHDVERRLVGPVEILQDDDRRAAKRATQRPEHLAGGCAALGHLRQLAADLGGDVEQRPERSRREQRLARRRPAPRPTAAARRKHARAPSCPTPASPASNTICPLPAVAHLRERGLEHREMLLALQQLHAATLRRHPPAHQPNSTEPARHPIESA